MKIHIQPTSRIITVEGSNGAVPARVWEGHTDNGIEVTVLVTRIAALREQDLSELDRALTEMPPPSVHTDAWPARLIL